MALRRTASLSTNTVLLVDDVQLNRAILGRMLSKMGFDVQEACDGQQAVELFQRCLPACVLLDLQMPIMDGWETAEQLRLWEDQQQLGRTPIVGCTALPLQEQWRESATVEASALSCGFDEMLNKMPTMAQLLAVLSKHIAGLPAAAAGVVATAAVSAAAATAAAASTVNGITVQVQA